MRRILVTGASGILGGYLLRHLSRQGMSSINWSGTRDGDGLNRVDLADYAAATIAFRAAAPDVVLHAAAMARVADCHRDPQRAREVNVAGTALLTDLCAKAGVRLVFVSTDMVFDGERAPYRETAPPSPLSVYGRSKAEAELAALAQPGNAVVRLSLLFGPSRTRQLSFFDEQVRALREGRSIALFEDEWRTPIDLATAAQALTELALSDAEGTFHLGGPERLSRLEMGRRLAGGLGIDPERVRSNRRTDAATAEPRPRDLSLDSSRWREAFPGLPWPGYAESVKRLLAG